MTRPGHNHLAENCQERDSAIVVGQRCPLCPEGECPPGCHWAGVGVAHVHKAAQAYYLNADGTRSPITPSDRWTCG